MKAYHDMTREVLNFGTRKENRTGVDTISTFNYNYELSWDARLYRAGAAPTCHVIDSADKDREGFAIPLLTTKDISWKNIVTEMLWFLSGQTNISILRQHGCKFWDPWVDEDGNVPSAYGNFWRQFPVHDGDVRAETTDSHAYDVPAGAFNDQIAWVLAELRRNPMSRRMVVSAWAPGNAQTSKLPPCHMTFTFNVQNMEESLESRLARANEALNNSPGAIQEAIRTQLSAQYLDTSEGRRLLDVALRNAGFTPTVEPRLCLHLLQRSCDLFLGVPYNMASYGLLLLIFSHLSGIKPGIFAHTLLDLHAYTSKPDGSKSEFDHVPVLKEQLERAPKALPRLIIDSSIKELSDIEALMTPDVSTQQVLEKFQLVGYDPWPALKGKVAV